MEINRQTGNTVGGDLTMGNKVVVNNYPVPATAAELSNLYAKLKENGIGDPSAGTFCQELEHYLAPKGGSDVRGLEAKLSESDRVDQLEDAMELKERVTKAVMRFQTSKTAQRVYTLVLTELHTNFTLQVTPQIQSGATRPLVDAQIALLLEQTMGMLGENFLEFSKRDLLGLLYFLGGNCHVRWDKC